MNGVSILSTKKSAFSLNGVDEQSIPISSENFSYPITLVQKSRILQIPRGNLLYPCNHPQ